MKKLNLERMRRHKMRTAPDRKTWYVPPMVDLDEFHRKHMYPWADQMKRKYANRPNMLIETEVVQRPDFGDYKVQAWVRFK